MVSETSLTTAHSTQPLRLNVANSINPVLPTYSTSVVNYKVAATARNTSTGAVGYNRFNVRVTRGGGNSASATITSVEEASTFIHKEGATFNLSVENPSAGGDAFDLVLTGTVAQAHLCRISVWRD